ncbi:MAG: hypothetical protein KatS3mg064_1024 [Tepidiforma sp.]|nr:hypothetical protein [Tepidiforma sp.]GIW17867.1 MAG: hypothetical protein KatS3mg064_1024 [Tepidiforma sp.]
MSAGAPGGGNSYHGRVRTTLAAALALISAAALAWQDVTGAGPDELTIATAAILVVSLQALSFPVEELLRLLGRLRQGG